MSLAKDRRVKARYRVNLPEQLMQCELNYWRLRQLLGDINHLNPQDRCDYIVGQHTGTESECRIHVIEQTKYTTLVHIVSHYPLHSTHQTHNNSLVDPCGLPVYCGDVRLYHDASVAEVVKCQRYQQFKARYQYPNVDMHQVDEKAQMNRFLGELLAHCLTHGRVAQTVISTYKIP